MNCYKLSVLSWKKQNKFSSTKSNSVSNFVIFRNLCSLEDHGSALGSVAVLQLWFDPQFGLQSVWSFTCFIFTFTVWLRFLQVLKFPSTV